MNKITGLLLIMLFSLPFISDAQRWKRYRYEVVYGIGATNFLGDLGGADQIGTDYFKDLEMKLTRPAAQLAMRYKITELTSLKMGFSYGVVAGDDNTTAYDDRFNRQFHFKSPIVEFGATYEFMFLKERAGHRYSLRGVKGIKKLELYPYGFFGFSAFYFNPKAKDPDSGKWTGLRNLNTEGQGIVPTRKQYGLFNVAMPMGMGFKYAVDRRWLIGIEYGIRKTFTDYIDDVSTTYMDPTIINNNYGPTAAYFADPTGGTWEGAYAGQQRGDPTDNDSYMFLIFSVNYKLRTGRNNLPKFNG